MSITVPASLFAPFTGRHRYRPQDEAIREIFERYETGTYEDIEAPFPEALIPLVNRRELTKKDHELASSLEPTSVIKNGTEHIINPCHQLAIARGVALERTVLDELNEKFKEDGSDYTARPHSQTHRLCIANIEIVGIVDALLYKGEEVVGVVEIKNRMKGFFSDDKLEAYRYDLDQLMCYHKLLGDSSKVLMLVQCYNGQIKSTYYTSEQMDERWESVQDELRGAIKKYHKMCSVYRSISGDSRDSLPLQVDDKVTV